MQSRITPLNTERKEWVPQKLVDQWQHHLQEHDRSAGTIKIYTQAVVRFLAWYEREEQAPLQLSSLTPIDLIGYRNELQHKQHDRGPREGRRGVSTGRDERAYLRHTFACSYLASILLMWWGWRPCWGIAHSIPHGSIVSQKFLN